MIQFTPPKWGGGVRPGGSPVRFRIPFALALARHDPRVATFPKFKMHTAVHYPSSAIKTLMAAKWEAIEHASLQIQPWCMEPTNLHGNPTHLLSRIPI